MDASAAPSSSPSLGRGGRGGRTHWGRWLTEPVSLLTLWQVWSHWTVTSGPTVGDTPCALGYTSNAQWLPDSGCNILLHDIPKHTFSNVDAVVLLHGVFLALMTWLETAWEVLSDNTTPQEISLKSGCFLPTTMQIVLLTPQSLDLALWWRWPHVLTLPTKDGTSTPPWRSSVGNPSEYYF